MRTKNELGEKSSLSSILSLKTKKYIVLFLPVGVVWLVDQVTKHWIRYSLELHRYEIIEGWLAFNYTRNPGMALGMDWLSTPAISIIAVVATIAIFIYILKTLEKANLAYLFCMGLIMGGALGNITDRLVMGLIDSHGGILHGHVIDFIHFTLTINDTPVFPYIFNVADMAISTSIIAMLLFHNKILPGEDQKPSGSGSKEGIGGESKAGIDSGSKTGAGSGSGEGAAEPGEHQAKERSGPGSERPADAPASEGVETTGAGAGAPMAGSGSEGKTVEKSGSVEGPDVGSEGKGSGSSAGKGVDSTGKGNDPESREDTSRGSKDNDGEQETIEKRYSGKRGS